MTRRFIALNMDGRLEFITVIREGGALVASYQLASSNAALYDYHQHREHLQRKKVEPT
jgi:hypothetical protein